jgi:peptide/nickel transport system substrate-binding protein
MVTYATSDTVQAYRSDRFSNPVMMTGEGLQSFWNQLRIEPRNGVSTFRFAKAQTVSNLNPLFGATLDVWVYNLIYDKLMRFNPDSLRPEPWAAESVDVVDDTTVDVTLRDGMTWHDGRPVTPQDVKFSYEYQAQLSPLLGSNLAIFDVIEDRGDGTVRFNLKQSYAPVLGQVFARAYLLPKHVWERIPTEVDAEEATGYTPSDPVGSGPFAVEEFRQQETLRMVPHDGHFQRPAVDEVEHMPVADRQSAVRFLESGDADAVGFIPPETAGRLQNTEGVAVVSAPNHGLEHLSFQTNRKPGDDTAFRRAIAHVIPRRDIVETILGGNGTIEPDSVITSPNEFWHNPNLTQRNYDSEEARRILREAGYTWDDQDRLRYPA